MSHVLVILLCIVVIGIAYLLGSKVLKNANGPIERVFKTIVGFAVMVAIIAVSVLMYGFYKTMHSIALSII